MKLKIITFNNIWRINMSSISKPELIPFTTGGLFPQPTGLLCRSDSQYTRPDGKKSDYFYIPPTTVINKKGHQVTTPRTYNSGDVKLWTEKNLLSQEEIKTYEEIFDKVLIDDVKIELGHPFVSKPDPIEPKTEEKPAPSPRPSFDWKLTTLERMSLEVVPVLERFYDYYGELPYNDIDIYITSLSKASLREKGELYLHLLKILFDVDIYSKEPFAKIRESVNAEKAPIADRIGDLCGVSKSLKQRKLFTLEWAEDICKQAKAELAAKAPAVPTAPASVFQKIIYENPPAPLLQPQPQPMVFSAPSPQPEVKPIVYSTPAPAPLITSPAPQPTVPVAPQPAPIVQQPVVPKFEAQNVNMISYIDLVFAALENGTDEERVANIPRIVLKDAVVHVLTFLSMKGGIEDTIRRLFANRLHDLYALHATLEREKLPSPAHGIDATLIEEGEAVLKLIYQDGLRKDYMGLMKRMERLANQLPRFYNNVYLMAVAAEVKIESWDSEWAKYHWNEPAYFHLSIQALERTLHT